MLNAFLGSKGKGVTDTCNGFWGVALHCFRLHCMPLLSIALRCIALHGFALHRFGFHCLALLAGVACNGCWCTAIFQRPHDTRPYTEISATN